jgi:hypothetical protein
MSITVTVFAYALFIRLSSVRSTTPVILQALCQTVSIVNPRASIRGRTHEHGQNRFQPATPARLTASSRGITGCYRVAMLRRRELMASQSVFSYYSGYGT